MGNGEVTEVTVIITGDNLFGTDEAVRVDGQALMGVEDGKIYKYFRNVYVNTENEEEILKKIRKICNS